MNICYICDNNKKQINMLCNSIKSIFNIYKINKTYIILFNITKKDILIYKSELNKYNITFIEFNDIDNYIKKFPELPNCKNIYLKLGALLRFNLHNLINEDNIFYIDNDTLFYNDISNNFIDIDKYLLIGFNDKCIKCKNYINSGLLYINLKFWREAKVFDKIIQLYNYYKDTIKWCNQDIYNKLFEYYPCLCINDNTINTNTKYIQREKIKVEHFFGPGKYDYKNALKYIYKQYESSINLNS